jgi:hypothetical protein
MNLGVYNAEFNKVLMVNDDNVFPEAWDQDLLEQYKPGSVLTPNQIEPTPSMFRQFHIKDLGRDPKTFDLPQFWGFCDGMNISQNFDHYGSTFPIYIKKMDYLRVGGFDVSYPGPWVVDCEFFMKCSLNKMDIIRLYSIHFYHFVSLSTKTPEQLAQAKIKEQECHDYFKYVWGDYMKRNKENKIYF